MKTSILWTVTPVDENNIPVGKQRLFKRASKANNMAKSFNRCLIEKNYYGSVNQLFRRKYKAWILSR